MPEGLNPVAKVLFFPSGVNLRIEWLSSSDTKRLPAASKAKLYTPEVLLSPDANVLLFPSGVNLKIESFPLSKRLPAASKASPPAWVLMESKIVSRPVTVTAINNLFRTFIVKSLSKLTYLLPFPGRHFDPLRGDITEKLKTP